MSSSPLGVQVEASVLGAWIEELGWQCDSDAVAKLQKSFPAAAAKRVPPEIWYRIQHQRLLFEWDHDIKFNSERISWKLGDRRRLGNAEYVMIEQGRSVFWNRYHLIASFTTFRDGRQLLCRIIFPESSSHRDQDRKSVFRPVLKQLHLNEDELKREPLLLGGNEDDKEYDTESDAETETGSQEYEDLCDARPSYTENEEMDYKISAIGSKLARRSLTIKPSDPSFEPALNRQGINSEPGRTSMAAFVTKHGIEESETPHLQSLCSEEEFWEMDMRKCEAEPHCFGWLLLLNFIDRVNLGQKFSFGCRSPWRTPPKQRMALGRFTSRPKPDLELHFGLNNHLRRLRRVLLWFHDEEELRIIQPNSANCGGHKSLLPFATFETPRQGLYQSERIACLRNWNSARIMLLAYHYLLERCELTEKFFKSVVVFTGYMDSHSLVLQEHWAREEFGELHFYCSEFSESIRKRRYGSEEAASRMRLIFQYAEQVLYPLIETVDERAWLLQQAGRSYSSYRSTAA